MLGVPGESRQSLVTSSDPALAPDTPYSYRKHSAASDSGSTILKELRSRVATREAMCALSGQEEASSVGRGGLECRRGVDKVLYMVSAGEEDSSLMVVYLLIYNPILKVEMRRGERK